MNNKKVIELIKKGMLYQSKSSHVSSYKEKAKNCFNEALDELQKSDWISVEDELPPHGEDVVVCNKEYNPNIKWVTRRVKEKVRKDIYDFYLQSYDKPCVTHWHKIDKLEV